MAVAGAGCDALFGLDEVPEITTACTIASVSAGRNHTCVVDGASRVWCWGLNDRGQIDDSGDRNVYVPRQVALGPRGQPVQVAAGREFTCARFASGNVACWGANTEGQLGTGPDGVTDNGGVTDVVLPGLALELGVGSDYACVILREDRSVACWGSNKHQALGRTDIATAGLPTVIPGTAGTKRLAVGHRHNCVVDAGDAVKCWGRGHQQQNGVAFADSADLVAIAGLGPVNDVSVGGRTSCALEMNGAVRCWGSGRDGQLGDGTFNTSTLAPSTPAVTDGLTLQVASLGGCATRDNTNDNIACWGLSEAGTAVTVAGASARTSTIEGVNQLSHRFAHVCATVGDQVLCWGKNIEGQLGRGSRSSTPSPTGVPDLAGVTHVAIGNQQTCVVANGQLSCWGNGDRGQIGDGSLRTAYTPVAVSTSLSSITGIASRWGRACAWRADAARCWGTAEFGETGNGTVTRHVSLPALVQNLTDVASISIGQYHTCARAASGLLKCWGRNHLGQLGVGTTTTATAPVTVPTSNVTSIATGGGHTCAVSLGTVYCWGLNDNGQLGHNTMSNINAPGASTPLPSAAVQVAAGTHHTCARTASELYCWGANTRGELGLGDRDRRLVPVLVALPAAVAEIDLAPNGTCARLVDGRVLCWGAGMNDELGNGASTDALTPVEIPLLANASMVVRSVSGGCAIRGGTLECWGSDIHLGRADASTSEPVAVPLSCR